MKAILEFNLPEDRVQFNAAARANDMAMALWSLAYNLRKRTERWLDEKEPDPDAGEVMEFIFGGISDEFDEYGIDIDNLTE